MTRAMRELFGSSGATGKVLTHYGTGVILHDHNPISKPLLRPGFGAGRRVRVADGLVPLQSLLRAVRLRAAAAAAAIQSNATSWQDKSDHTMV